MKESIVPIMRCPRCRSTLGAQAVEHDRREIRRGNLRCEGPRAHEIPVEDGIIHTGAGLEHAVVQRELSYEDSTYGGDQRMFDPELIGGFPATLQELWPHTRHFGIDFEALVDLLDIGPDTWTLDVGTAACWTSRILGQRGGRVIAMDINGSPYYGLRAADIQFDAHDVYFERILSSMTDLPLRDGCLDHIVFNASFHHTPDMERTLDECWRVLKPGGVVAMANEEFVSWRHQLLPSAHADDERGAHHTIAYSDFEAAARRRGFTVSYRVTRHVEDALDRRLPRGIGRAVTFLAHQAPLLVKQLNSAVVLLRKARLLEARARSVFQ